MIGFAALLQPDQGQPARSVRFLAKADFEAWLAEQPEPVRTLAAASKFAAKPGETFVLPGPQDSWEVVVGAGEHGGYWDLAVAASRLPMGTYRMAGESAASPLGWLLAHYRFDRYLPKADAVPKRVLLSSEPAAIVEAVRIAEATALVRDLVNTPAADMGPGELQQQAEALARSHGGTTHVTKGHELETGYPMIHAVGRAAEKRHAPRLIELEWGNPDHPRIAIVGKGVTFDSGGLNIKPSSGMKIMKKDMGGAAHSLALARLVMESRLEVRLHLLIPAVENAISGGAFRPGDILTSRAGITVEIDNTDAEGRLILGDALTKAGEGKPELVIDFATLTGAARTALGPDLPALFSNDHALADAINRASVAVHDPVWRLPLWGGYSDMLKSEIADTLNSGEGGMAGAITAALFLRKFVPAETPWVHLDTWAWRATAKPGRPKGGEALGLRAIWQVLQDRYLSI